MKARIENYPGRNGRPTDEYGGRIEIRDGRIPRKKTAGNDGERVRHKCTDDQHSSPVDQSVFAEKPTKQAQDKHKQIELRRFHEGGQPVVEDLEWNFRVGLEVFLKIIQCFVELPGIGGPIGA